MYDWHAVRKEQVGFSPVMAFQDLGCFSRSMKTMTTNSLSRNTSTVRRPHHRVLSALFWRGVGASVFLGLGAPFGGRRQKRRTVAPFRGSDVVKFDLTTDMGGSSFLRIRGPPPKQKERSNITKELWLSLVFKSPNQAQFNKQTDTHIQHMPT